MSSGYSEYGEYGECRDCGQGMLVPCPGGRCEACREQAWRKFQRECAREWQAKQTRAGGR